MNGRVFCLKWGETYRGFHSAKSFTLSAHISGCLPPGDPVSLILTRPCCLHGKSRVDMCGSIQARSQQDPLAEIGQGALEMSIKFPIFRPCRSTNRFSLDRPVRQTSAAPQFCPFIEFSDRIHWQAPYLHQAAAAGHRLASQVRSLVQEPHLNLSSLVAKACA